MAITYEQTPCLYRKAAVLHVEVTEGTVPKVAVQGKDGEDAFTFTSEGCAPGAWQFEKLTIERFRRETYKIVEGGNYIAQTIRSTADLHEWYRKRYGEAAGLCFPRVNNE